MPFRAMHTGERHEGAELGFSFVHERRQHCQASAQQVAHMDAAASPTRLEDLHDGGLQAFVRIGNNAPGAAQRARFELAQQAEPEDGGLRGA